MLFNTFEAFELLIDTSYTGYSTFYNCHLIEKSIKKKYFHKTLYIIKYLW